MFSEYDDQRFLFNEMLIRVEPSLDPQTREQWENGLWDYAAEYWNKWKDGKVVIPSYRPYGLGPHLVELGSLLNEYSKIAREELVQFLSVAIRDFEHSIPAAFVLLPKNLWNLLRQAGFRHIYGVSFVLALPPNTPSIVSPPEYGRFAPLLFTNEDLRKNG